MCSDTRDRNSAVMKANNAEITGGMIRDLITRGERRSGSVRVQGEDISGKSQVYSCLSGF
jgi:hypothetical protein